MRSGDGRWAGAPGEEPNRPESRGPGHPLWTPEAWALDPDIFDVVGGTGEAHGANATTTARVVTHSEAKDDRTMCEVVGCSELRSAARGAGLCEKHRHADSFIIAESNGGAPMRWCFYCHRAHDLGAFSSASKSICHEKFTLRQKRRQARRAGGSHASGDFSKMTMDGRTSSDEKKSNESGGTSMSLPEAAPASSFDDEAGLASVGAALSAHQTQTAPHGVDAKFWVAHPRELQERMDMWNLVRRLNSQEEPAGMFGTIVPGCVRLTVRGWRSAQTLRDEENLEHRLISAFADQILTKGDVLHERVSVCELKSIEYEPRRIDTECGILQNALALCTKHRAPATPRRVFVNANDVFEVNVEAEIESSPVVVRFFSEYIECERVIEDAAQRVVKIPQQKAKTNDHDVIDHVLSVQVGGYGAPYTHYAMIADDDIARELVELDASMSRATPEAHQMLLDFAFDYVWLSNHVERAMLRGEEDLARARYIEVSARKVLSAIAATHTLERLDILRDEIEEIAKNHETTAVVTQPSYSRNQIPAADRSTISAKLSKRILQT